MSTRENALSETAPSARAQADSKALNRLGLDIVTRLHIAYKAGKLYDANNALFQEQARGLFDAIAAALSPQEELVLRSRQDSLFVNGQRLKYPLASYNLVKSVLGELRRRSLGSIRFRRGLTADELSRFIGVLCGQAKAVRTIPFDETARLVAAAGLPHLEIDKIIEADGSASAEKNTARMYFLSILHLREAFERDRREEKIRIGTTRRLMQTLFNHLSENEAFALGMTSIKNHDEYTLNHSVNVCLLSLALGRRLGLNRAELVDLGIAAFFHDLGKLETPLDILNKPARLSDEERGVMERHPHQGAEKLLHLRESRSLPLRSIHVAMEHHIKEDLTGYPRYVHRTSVNLFSKIVKITDYYDAITTPRVYRKKAFTPAEALALMLEQSGSEFNAAILKAFAGLVGPTPVGTLVALDTGEIGIVYEIHPETRFLMRPRVKIAAGPAGNRVNGDIVDLTERDPETNRFRRSIVKPLDPDAYGIRVGDYFLAEAR